MFPRALSRPLKSLQYACWFALLPLVLGCASTARQTVAPPPARVEPAATPAGETKPARDEEKTAPAAPAPAKQAAPPPSAPAVAGSAPASLGDINTFAAGTPDETIRKALRCALDGDFDGYVALHIRANVDTQVLLSQMRNYQWKVFVQRAASYVVAKEPFTFRVTRRDNEGDTGSTPRRHKVFLYSGSRDYPAPITLQVEDGVWKIYANSL